MVRCFIGTDRNHFKTVAKCIKNSIKTSTNETKILKLLFKYSKLIPIYNEQIISTIIDYINKPKQRVIGEETEKKLFTNISIAKLINELKNHGLNLEPSRDLKEFRKFLEELSF